MAGAQGGGSLSDIVHGAPAWSAGFWRARLHPSPVGWRAALAAALAAMLAQEVRERRWQRSVQVRPPLRSTDT